MPFQKIYPVFLFLFVFQLFSNAQDNLKNDLIKNKIPKTLQLSHIEIQEQFIDFKKLNDPVYCQKIKFGKALRQSFDSVASHYNYPLNLNLPHYLNTLTFHFSAIEWKAPNKIKYSYFLDGLDKDWSEPKNQAKVAYRNLPHGAYTLKIKAIGESQIWSKPFLYSFNIRSPWWKTRAAYLIYGLILVTVCAGIFHIWQVRKKEVEEMQQLLAAHKAMAFSTAANRKQPTGSGGFLNLVHQTLETHLSDENFGIAELCEILNISRAQLHRKLKKLTGQSTSHYIRSLRLDIAKDMLEKTDLNVSEVAFSVGFSSATYFSKVFKAEFGRAPRELR